MDEIKVPIPEELCALIRNSKRVDVMVEVWTRGHHGPICCLGLDVFVDGRSGHRFLGPGGYTRPAEGDVISGRFGLGEEVSAAVREFLAWAKERGLEALIHLTGVPLMEKLVFSVVVYERQGERLLYRAALDTAWGWVRLRRLREDGVDWGERRFFFRDFFPYERLNIRNQEDTVGPLESLLPWLRRNLETRKLSP
jgi:hypothetical protein